MLLIKNEEEEFKLNLLLASMYFPFPLSLFNFKDPHPPYDLHVIAFVLFSYFLCVI